MITAFTFQFYFIINGFWTRVNLQGGWNNSDVHLSIYLNEENGQTGTSGVHTFGLTALNAYKCSLAMVISFMGISGRAGPIEALFISILGTIGFEVTRQIQTLMAQVTGCSNYVFTFAGFMGGIIGLLLNKCNQTEIM